MTKIHFESQLGGVLDVYERVRSDLVSLDDSQFPLVILRLSGDLQDTDYEDIFSRIQHVLERQSRFIMISDLRGLTSIANARRRQQIADRLKELEEKYGKLEVGTVRIVDSDVVRAGLMALQWVTGRTDGQWVKDMPQAIETAKKLAERAGLTLPSPNTIAGQTKARN